MLALFDIPVDLEADFDKFKTRYDSFSLVTLAGTAAALSYVMLVEACIISLQFGDLTRAQFNTFTGLDLTV